MDPLSATASIITLIGAAGVVGKGLGRLASLRHAPTILLELNDEVAGLHLIVQSVHVLIHRHHNNLEYALPIANLCRALEKSQTTLHTLSDLLTNRLTVEDKNGQTRLDRSVWLRCATKVSNIKEQVRFDRIELSFALNLLASYVFSDQTFIFNKLNISVSARHPLL